MDTVRAIIFDLFGTLVSTFSSLRHDYVLWEMADVLGVEREAFAEVFDNEMRRDREVGKYPTLEKGIEQACEKLGVKADRQSILQAAQLKRDFTRQALRPRDGAIEVLKYIKASGYVIGLVSDSAPEVPVVWEETDLAPWMDAAVFSCKVGVKKPNPRIYKMACASLGVLPEECIYVGDGDSMELEGAKHVGMVPILIRVREEEGWDRDRPVLERWEGRRIEKLTEVLELLDLLQKSS